MKKCAKYLGNFERVQKMTELEERDKIRNFQPPITGDEIMRLFNLPGSRVIGDIKEQIKEAILEGEIKNSHDEAMQLLLKIAKEKGLINQNVNPKTV